MRFFESAILNFFFASSQCKQVAHSYEVSFISCQIQTFYHASILGIEFSTVRFALPILVFLQLQKNPELRYWHSACFQIQTKKLFRPYTIICH